jgi:hypothetical protein
MAEWGFENITFIDSKFEDIHILFLSGKITTMYQLVSRSPTKVAKLLGINYDSYHSKLKNPENFTEYHINTLAYAFKIDPDLIHNIIQKEIREKVVAKVAEFEKRKK